MLINQHLSPRFDDGPSTGGIPTAQNIREIIAFDVLYGVGLVLLILIVLTGLYSPRIRQRLTATWFNMLVGWILTSMSNLMIVGQQTGPPPRRAICLMQASMVYAAPVLNSFTAFAFILQVYLSLKRAVRSDSPVLSRNQIKMFNIFPWVAFFLVLIEVLVVGIMNPGQIQRNIPGTYCNLSGAIGYGTTAGLTVCAMVGVLVIEVLIGLLFRKFKKESSETLRAIRDNDLFSSELIARLCIFCFCPMIALAVSCAQYFPGQSRLAPGLQLVIAILPICAILIFGSQRDILRAWIYCQWKA